jgi:hypothetical protein
MKMQPRDRASTMPIPVLPRMPAADATSELAPAKERPTRVEAMRVAKARVTRRSSLRKQREAMKG